MTEDDTFDALKRQPFTFVRDQCQYSLRPWVSCLASYNWTQEEYHKARLELAQRELQNHFKRIHK